jgi:hypothetical protein
MKMLSLTKATAIGAGAAYFFMSDGFMDDVGEHPVQKVAGLKLSFLTTLKPNGKTGCTVRRPPAPVPPAPHRSPPRRPFSPPSLLTETSTPPRTAARRRGPPKMVDLANLKAVKLASSTTDATDATLTTASAGTRMEQKREQRPPPVRDYIVPEDEKYQDPAVKGKLRRKIKAHGRKAPKHDQVAPKLSKAEKAAARLHAATPTRYAAHRQAPAPPPAASHVLHRAPRRLPTAAGSGSPHRAPLSLQTNPNAKLAHRLSRIEKIVDEDLSTDLTSKREAVAISRETNQKLQDLKSTTSDLVQQVRAINA